MERTRNQVTGTGKKELGTRKPVQVLDLGNINRIGSGDLTIETVNIETGGGRYPKFVYKSSPRKKPKSKKTRR